MRELLLSVFAISVLLFVRNILMLIFHIDNMKTYKKRMKQLKFEGKKDADMNSLIDTVTKPIIEVVFPVLNITDLSRLEEKLKYAKYKMNAKQFLALRLFGTVIGVVMFAIFSMADGMFFGIVWLVLLAVLPQFLLNNSVKNRKEKLMLEFPEFIRIAKGYLSAGKTFERAVMESIPFVSPEWQELLRMFIAKSQAEDIPSALDFLKEEVGTLEAKEFISVVNLTLEQGGSAKEGFNAQADKIEQMIYDMMLTKISKRKIVGILLQAPLLLCNIAVMGLPVVDAFMNMGL